MFSTYKKDDVIILLKDITGLVTPQPASEREQLIQKEGRHYSEMLPIEYEPTEKYMRAYNEALNRFAKQTANAVGRLARKIFKTKGEKAALVSLARAGTPIGILLKRYMRKFFSVNPNHYTVSIIRDRGIDKNAVNYILKRENPSDIQFVDGWTGKGAIARELKKAAAEYENVESSLGVLSDPAHITKICGTHEDFLIPNSCLNSTVSGLLSRTFFRKDIIGENDFHGAAFYKELAPKDLTYEFIETVEKNFKATDDNSSEIFKENSGLDEVNRIAKDFGVKDINLIKPGIGEATRVLLRRMPDKILVRSLQDEKRLGHLYELAEEKGIKLEEYPLQNYLAVGLILSLADN